MIPENLLYTPDHEWAGIENDTAVIGITDHAQEMLGEITFVELPSLNRDFESHDELAMVESSKAAADIYCPLKGTVTEVNSQLETNPELINDDCYNAGWICKIKITDPESAKKLMNASQYEQYLKGL